MNGQEFQEYNKGIMDIKGMWVEETKSSIIHKIETNFKRDILKDMYISDISFSEDKILLKWNKRYRPLSDDEVKEKYGE